jgi:hypothetical protein
MTTYRLAIYHSPHDYTEPYRVAIISPGRRPEKADGADSYDLVMVVDLGVSDLPPIRTDELLTAPSALHESAVAFGLLAEPLPGDVPLEHLDGPHRDSPADRLHEALKRGQPPDDLDDQL